MLSCVFVTSEHEIRTGVVRYVRSSNSLGNYIAIAIAKKKMEKKKKQSFAK